ncbi:MAG: putative ABC transport system permease protein, partial [Oleispira sp.]
MTIISWLDLAWCLIPIILVCGVYIAWQGKPSEIIIAVLRMAVQLVAVGYVLISIFENPSPWISAGIVSIMLFVAAWIAIRPVR